MQLSPLTSSDLPLLSLLQPEGWPDIVPVYAFYLNSPFCFPVKVTIANEIVGIGTSIMHNDVAWLAHIIAHPDYRNRGVGKLITHSLVESIDSRVCKTIYLIATEFGESIYEKQGFVTETEYVFYKKFSKDELFKPSYHIVPYTEKHKEEIKRLDQSVSGEDRLFHFEAYLSNAYVYITNNHVEGFYIPDFHEGFIIASTSKAGIELMHLRLQSKNNAVFPINNTDASNYMSMHGYEPFKVAKRMRLGEIREVAFANMFNRIAGSIG